MKKVIVISLGGSVIVPGEIDIGYLRKFKQIIDKHKNNYNFVIVTGGGSIARKYISALRKENKPVILQNYAGIAVTRMNARFLSYLFGKQANEGIPMDMEHVKNLLKKNNPVFCGALRYSPNQTSDSTSAKLANFFSCNFINITKVPGLYNKNPEEHKDAVFIPNISWRDFYERAKKIEYKPGMHFVLDLTASKIIKESKIPTFIIGKDIGNLDNLLSGKKFKATIIEG